MYVDTASDSRLVSDSTQVMISAIVMILSNATWSVILKDGSGNIIFQADNNGSSAPFCPSVPFLTTGLVVNTLTNAKLLIYTTP